MKRPIDVLALLSFSLFATCPSHVLAQQVASFSTPHTREPVGLPKPYRQLPWNDVNFLSTSDSHGWLLGHQHQTWPEPNYSGDYGDFASFVTHMRTIANNREVDLLLVDAGDHHDGSGLVSSSPLGAERAEDIFHRLEYDVMTIGNHELYIYDIARVAHEQAKKLNGRFITSNVNITIEENGQVVSVPIGERYRKFETNRGRKVTALGCIFDFQAHDYNLSIQSTSDMVKEIWFQEVIAEAPDYFIVAGHMPVKGDSAEFKAVYEAIRSLHPHTPIFIFGGHTHVRDCEQYDDHSIAIVPGRYMETIAFTSSNLPAINGTGPLDMDRRYIDANRVSYQYHTATKSSRFDTDLGKDISTDLLALASHLNISASLGEAPQDYYLGRYPYGHQNSALTLFAEKILPAVVVDEKRKGKRVIIGNSGSLRFDVFAGPFTRNDELTMSPFGSNFVYTQLPASLAKLLLPEMNRRGASKLLPTAAECKDDPRINGRNRTRAQFRDAEEKRVNDVYEDWLLVQWLEHLVDPEQDNEGLVELYEQTVQQTLGVDNAEGGERLTPGYVTRDRCKGAGDDVKHIPLPRAINQPDFLASPFPEAAEDELIDVVSMDFSLDDLIAAVHSLKPGSSLGPWDFVPYAEGVTTSVLWGRYASMAWND